MKFLSYVNGLKIAMIYRILEVLDAMMYEVLRVMNLTTVKRFYLDQVKTKPITIATSTKNTIYIKVLSVVKNLICIEVLGLLVRVMVSFWAGPARTFS